MVLGAFAKFRKAPINLVISVCPSVCPYAWDNSDHTRRILIKFDVLYEDVFTFMAICRVVYEIMSKIWWSQRDRKCQSGDPLHASIVRLPAAKHTLAPTHSHKNALARPLTQTQLRARIYIYTHTHTHTHT